MNTLFDNLPSPESLRESAERERARAVHAAESSEYPRLARSAHNGLADALEKLADTIESTPAPETTGNRREDRRARRIARLRLRAAKLRKEAAETWVAEHNVGARIPFGQPILVGHHSEGRHRRAIERMHRLTAKALALHNAAIDAEQAARAAERNNAIYADDPDAPDKLRERIAELERKQEFFKRTNAAIRKRDAVALADLMANTSSDRLRGMIERRETIPAYALSNNSANIRRLRERLAKVEALQTMTERPERRIGDVVVRDNLEFQKVELHFPGKPDESLRRDLKRWGFRW